MNYPIFDLKERNKYPHLYLNGKSIIKHKKGIIIIKSPWPECIVDPNKEYHNKIAIILKFSSTVTRWYYLCLVDNKKFVIVF